MGDVREFKKIVRMFFFKYLTFFLLQFMRCTNNKVNVNVNIDIVTIATTKMQMTTFLNLEQEKFEDSKGVIRSRK